MPRILIVDDDADILLLLKKFFGKKGFEVKTTDSGAEAIVILKKWKADVVLCDFKLPDYSGIDILQKIKIINPGTQVIIITGYSDVRVAVDALKKGAFEYVTKPLYPDEILMMVKQAIEKSPGQKEDTPAEKRKNKILRPLKYIHGISQQARSIEKQMELIAPTDMSVVIQGETGTGKEYVAREIHGKSRRKSQSFIAVDCGALPNDLAGSELFGHVKGAFTGAVVDKVGSFELANGGTLFLDEIGNLSYENQIKLLRVLQEKMIKKVGGIKDIPVDVRLVVATNENLIEAVRRGDFREDLYHRINEFRIEVPPLRERPEDIVIYAEYFLKQANEQLEKDLAGLEDDVLNYLRRYYWDGNLRELRNVIKRSVLLCEGSKVQTQHLPPEIITNTRFKDEFETGSPDRSVPVTLKDVVQKAEKKAILEVLRMTNNNKSKTAEILDVDRKTLYNKLKAYDIDL